MFITEAVPPKSPGLQSHPRPARPRKHRESNRCTVSESKRIVNRYANGTKLHTSLVDECNILTFFAVRMYTKLPVSMFRISMKLGSNARMYGWKIANEVGVPSHVIFHSGNARQP